MNKIEEMNLEEIEARLAEITSEVETRAGEELDVLKNEVIELQARKAELEDIEKRTAIAKELEKGNIVGETKEERKEEIKMEERTFAIDTVEYRDAYLKSLMGKTLSVEERTALTSANSVIPTQTVNKIYGLLEENQLIGEIDALRIGGYVSIPVANTVNDANWLAMATASTDSADVVGTVSLTAKKLIKTVEITADIQAMSIPAFEGWLVKKLAQKMESAITSAIINGAGNATVPQGVGQCGLTASTAITTPDVKKLAKFMAGVGTAYHKNAVWVMSATTFFDSIVPLANDSNGAVVMNGLDYRLLGHKVILDANVDDCKFKNGSTQESANGNHIIFGDFKDGYVFNYGEGIAIEADQSVAFRSGSTVYRAMALCDGAVVDKDAFAYAVIS